MVLSSGLLRSQGDLYLCDRHRKTLAFFSFDGILTMVPEEDVSNEVSRVKRARAKDIILINATIEIDLREPARSESQLSR